MIGSTGLSVTELGVGAAPLGNLYRQVSSDDAEATLRAALSAGFRYVDTAPYYGFGLSERRVGDAVRGASDVVVSTKVGRLLSAAPEVRDATERHGFHSPMPFEPEYDYSYDGIMRSWEASLQRLGLARVDILLVHDIGRLTHQDRHQATFDQLTSGGGFKALEELRAGRAIRAFGLGVNETAVCHEAMKHAHLDVVLLAGRYTLLEQGALDALFPACAVSGTCVIVGGPYNSGILATGTRGHETMYYDYASHPSRLLSVCRTSNRAAIATAYRYRVQLSDFRSATRRLASVIPGLGSAQRIQQTLELYRREIPEAFWEDLKANGLLRAGCASSYSSSAQLMVVDAHQHFWDPTRDDYGWLTPSNVQLYRRFGPENLSPLLAEAGAACTVLVQAAASEDETKYLFSIAAGHKFVGGVVGWVDFEADDVDHRILRHSLHYQTVA